MGKTTIGSNLQKTSERLDKDGNVIQVEQGNNLQQKMNNRLARLGIVPQIKLVDLPPSNDAEKGLL